MHVGHSGRTALPNRERWVAAAVLVLVVVLRSIVFVFWEQSFFDSDQAITGLMAKHLIEGRAFPVFFYGQNHMLGVDAYLAAPVFAVAGVSVTTLKLPLLVLNIGVALLLLRTLERDVGLRPYLALVPVLFFALPSPAAASEMLAPYGGALPRLCTHCSSGGPGRVLDGAGPYSASGFCIVSSRSTRYSL